MKKFKSLIFRAYDIRGKYPQEINKEIAFKLGWALVEFLKKRKKTKKINILVGRDNRLSSPILFKSLAQGILNSGGKVISLGICTTPMLYFATAHYKFNEGGVMITASHLAKEYNGFKLVEKESIPIDQKSGLKEIEKLMLKKVKFDLFPLKKIEKKNILKDYLKFILKDFDFKKILPLKIVIDTGNSPTGILIPEIFKKTKCKVFHLFKKLDGNFKNRKPNCTKKENLKKLKKEILKRKADLGVAFDGDGDRIVFLDERGEFVFPDFITALIIKLLLKENPGQKILYTVRESRIIPETIKENGGRALISKVGHSNVKKKMRKENILFCGETSGHYYSKDHYFSEAPFFVLFKILNELSKSKKTLSQLIEPFKKYYSSGEINFKKSFSQKEWQKEIKKLKKFYQGGKILKIDGLKIEYPDWWFNLRPSQTENLLRLVVEAKTKKLMEKKKKEIIKILKLR